MVTPVQRPEAAVSGENAAAKLAAGRLALQRGAWTDAVAAFSRVVETEAGPSETTAEAWAGIGLASYWIGDASAATEAHERAFVQYRELGRKAAAARMALWLVDEHLAFFGAHAVANGWIEQAERLVADSPRSVERVWLLAYRGHCALHVAGDPRQALELAREGHALALAVGASDAEVVTLALEGLALVQLGEVRTGMARLDAASAAAVTRELTDLNAVAWACCYLVHGCESIRDLPRAAEWCQRTMAFCERWGLAPIYASCRIDYAAVLTLRGEWETAEAELVGAAGEHPRGMSPGLEHLRQVRLGELRRRQGRLDEAETHFRRAGEHPLAIVGCAAIALIRGEPAVALDLCDRALLLLPQDSWLERVDALVIRVRAAAELGSIAQASANVVELATTAERGGTALLLASAACARGIAAAASADLTAAKRAFEEAVAHNDRGGAPYEAAHARLDLAAVLDRLGRQATARREAAQARDILEALGAQRDLERADALLREPPGPTEPQPPLTRREIEILELVARGWSNQRIAAELFLSPHTVKRHVANILRKLDSPSRAAAVAQGTRLGLLT